MNNKFHILSLSLDRLTSARRIMLNRTAASKQLYVGQPPILFFIGKHPGCSQTEIAVFMSVSPASIAASTKRLQRAGFIDKQIDRANLRCNQLYLTEKGKEVIRTCKKDFEAIEEHTFKGFTENELDQLQSFVERMQRNVESDKAFVESFGESPFEEKQYLDEIEN